MKIRSKVAALLAALFVVLGAAGALVAAYIVLPSFAELERADAHTAMRRIDYTLALALDRLAVSATDWGNWADTYQYVLDRNPDFVAANLTPLALRQLGVNMLLIVDRDGEVLRSNELDLDLDGDRPLGLDFAARTALPADFPWRADLIGVRPDLPDRGLLRTNRGILMLAAGPVLDGRGQGPARGMVIVGRLLSPAVVKDIGARAQAALTMLPPPASETREQLVESADTAYVYRAFDDLYGRPAMTLRVDIPRAITARGHTAVRYASAYLLGAALVVVILLMLALDRMVLDPLSVVTRHAVAVGRDTDLTTRLNLTSQDEIGVLAGEFDRMVARVAASRTQLVDQSYQAGFAELAKGVLHNLGNAMTPIGVRLAKLAERLRLAPADDARQALTELKDEAPDPQRRADLEEFARLACGELALAVCAAREDLSVMQSQASAMQSILTEQMRPARNQQVIEAVRLTELVAQSLEIVPDACRQRLTVDTDGLRALGVVRVARTVLRLVLQNLIINAADAVRDAGKEKGLLRVSAEIVGAADHRELRLHCRDDGVGIPADNLSRLFEKGFTTKSRETNQGIGLHWCANSLNALGGRIWADSDGPGRGACLHLTVPLAVREAVAPAGAA